MNHQLITKVIKQSNETCPNIVYENPLLDKNMASALAKSFVKILKTSDNNSNSTVSTNLRLCVLENIRKLCIVEPEGHKTVDDNLTAMLTDFYNMHLEVSKLDSTDSDRKLDAFLVRRMKELDIDSKYSPDLNPEVIQALINLNSRGVYLEKLSADLINWDINSDRHMNLIKNLWKNDDALGLLTGTLVDDVAVKMKAELERSFLELSYYLMKNRDINIKEYISSIPEYQNIVKKCSMSGECFQMCIGIINFIFITSNYDLRLQEFIPVFVENVKSKIPIQEFLVRYPMHLSSVVIYLDIDLAKLYGPVKDKYIRHATQFLKRIHVQSEYDLILLLSHYPQWFDIYFDYIQES